MKARMCEVTKRESEDRNEEEDYESSERYSSAKGYPVKHDASMGMGRHKRGGGLEGHKYPDHSSKTT